MPKSESFNTVRAKRIVGPAAYQGLGVGNVYHVFQTGQDKYAQMWADLHTVYSDGSVSVYNTIHDAVNACVSERNDYVIVYPDATDYDEGETIALDTTSTHLICPAGVGSAVGQAMRAATIDPAAAAHAVTITGRGAELAGFWIRGYADKDCVRTSGAGVFIHHNDIACTSSGTLGHGIYIAAGGDGTKVEYNYIFSNVSGGTTIAGIYGINGVSRLIVRGNEVIVDNATFTSGIFMPNTGTWSIVDSNTVFESPDNSSVVTTGIAVGTGVIATRNLVGITTTANALTGGTADESTVLNYSSKSGGALLLGGT